MSKEKIKDLIICLVALTVLVLTITTNVFAQDLGALTSGNNEEENEFEEIEEDENLNVSLNENLNTNLNTNVNENVNENENENTVDMPDAGVDYSVVMIIVVCGISAVYAYKKIKDYNNI